MNDLIEDKIKSWLKTQGYPLEMRVASAFQEKGFLITQSDYYKDPESDKYREVDIVASLSTYADQTQHVTFEIKFVIECKYSHEKPWLLFQGYPDRLQKDHEIVFRHSNSPGSVALLELSLHEDMKNNDLFKLTPRLSYGVTRAMADQTDVPYQAVLTVAKAARALADRSEEWNKNKIISVEIFFPVVLVDGRLFECALNVNNDLKLTEVNRGTLLFRNPAAGAVRALVDIVSIDGLPEYIKLIESGCKHIFSRVTEGLPRFRSYLSK